MGFALPADYWQLMREPDRLEGFAGDEVDVILWSASEAVELDRAYHVRELAPGLVLVGTDGGNTGFGLRPDGRGQVEYVSVPLIGMELSEVRVMGRSLEELVRAAAEWARG